MFGFLRSLDLNPMEWAQAVELTGKGAPYVGEVLDVAFTNAQAVVVLFTPDDLAKLRPELCSTTEADDELNLTPQARPNVIFEAGMAMARNAERTIFVEIGSLRPFSDIGGRHTIRIDNSTQKRNELASRLKQAGCPVTLTGTDWHTTGDLAPPTVRTITENESSHQHGNTDRLHGIKQADLAGAVLYASPSAAFETSIGERQSQPVTNIYGELYRLAFSPRTLAWEVVRDLYKLQGQPEDAKVDCDTLLEIYLVNLSEKDSFYIRDMKLSVETKNEGRQSFVRQDDLRAIEINHKPYEYGLSQKHFGDVAPLRPLATSFPVCLSLGQPIEGWVRFLATNMNPENIVDKTWQITVIDSRGMEHPITKLAERENAGEVGLRQLYS